MPLIRWGFNARGATDFESGDLEGKAGWSPRKEYATDWTTIERRRINRGSEDLLLNIRKTISKTRRRNLKSMGVLSLWLALAAQNPLRAVEDAELAALRTEAAQSFKKHVAPFVKNYCIECHGNRRTKGSINFEPAVKTPGEASAILKWKQAFANVSAHDMPPEDADQPPKEERERFLAGLGKIKFLSEKDPGPFVIRRLTKAEYGNTLRDLFGVDPQVAAELPDEVAGEGYLNSLSPMQTEQYLGIANQVLDQVLPSEGKPSTQARKWLFDNPAETGADPREAAEKVARSLARQAYRRPPSEDEIDTLLSVFDLGHANQLGDVASTRLMLKAALVSPQFLFITPAKEAEAGRKIVPVDDYQLASRLSYLLWATMPDGELFELAEAGKLHEAGVLKAQVQRMLADPRARALFDGFGAHWLGLGKLQDKTFDAEKFPQMTPQLRAAMYDEARLFFESIVRENRSVIGFVESDYTYLNSTLAKVYGLEQSVTHSRMRKVRLTDANRGGILVMPGVLAATSFPNRTSPVIRGVWVLEQVLGEHVPPAPADVPPLDDQDQKAVADLTLRQRTELHRTNAVCANCHRILDPIGFGLENFDAIGQWRVQDDSGGAIDAAGELPGGKRFSSPKELKAIIAARRDDLARNLTERFMAYALCRQLEGYDEIVVDQLMKTIAQDGYRMRTLITEVILSYPFLNRRVED